MRLNRSPEGPILKSGLVCRYWMLWPLPLVWPLLLVYLPLYWWELVPRQPVGQANLLHWIETVRVTHVLAGILRPYSLLRRLSEWKGSIAAKEAAGPLARPVAHSSSFDWSEIGELSPGQDRTALDWRPLSVSPFPVVRAKSEGRCRLPRAQCLSASTCFQSSRNALRPASVSGWRIAFFSTA